MAGLCWGLWRADNLLRLDFQQAINMLQLAMRRAVTLLRQVLWGTVSMPHEGVQHSIRGLLWGLLHRVHVSLLL